MAEEREQRFELNAPGLAKLVQMIDRFIRDDAALRLEQSKNAPQASYFGQQSITGGAIFQLPEAQSDAQSFSGAVIFTDTPSGSGRYTIHGVPPTAGGVGIPIPAGGTVIELLGMANLQRLKIIAETAQTLNLTYQLFK